MSPIHWLLRLNLTIAALLLLALVLELIGWFLLLGIFIVIRELPLLSAPEEGSESAKSVAYVLLVVLPFSLLMLGNGCSTWVRVKMAHAHGNPPGMYSTVTPSLI